MNSDGQLKLNLGCWYKKLPGFVNIDIDPNQKPDVVADFRKLPYGDGEVSELYCGHVIEHNTLPEVQACMREWRRVLKPGGVLTVTIPDIKKGYDGLKNGTVSLDLFHAIIFGGAESREAQDHHSVFDTEILVSTLEPYFTDIRVLDDSPLLFARVPWQTIVTCRKPENG